MVKIQRIFWIFVLLGLWPWLADAAQVRAVADRDRISVEESLHLELRVDGRPDADPDLSPLDKDWEVLSRSQNSQMQIVNGSFTRSLVYSLTLMPRNEGTLTIPAICFGSDCSSPLSIRVTTTDPVAPGADDSEILLETEATPYQLFTQQQLLFKVRLLHRVDLLQGALSDPQPSGVDAVVQKLGDDRNYETRRAGRLYQVIERSYAIFPQASGTLELPSLRFDGDISRGGSSFDPFGGRGQRVRKRSQAIPIKVLPPPADLGSRHWLPAQSLSLSDDWQGQSKKFTVGEPATRTLTLTAAGLQGAQLPELRLDIPDEFKSYPDQPVRKDDAGVDGITGLLQQKIALVPTRPGRYQLPAIDLDWWDVGAREWRRAHLDPVDIEVIPAPEGSAVAPPPTQPPPEPSLVPSASAPVLTANPAPVTVPTVPRPDFWPWLSLALGLGWLTTLLLLGWKKVQRPRPAGPADPSPLLREKSARKAVLKAARDNEPQAARKALADWCKVLWPDSGTTGLERLKGIDSAFQTEIDRLNRALYASGGENWIGEGLLEAIRQWDRRRQEKTADDKLPDLYPTQTRNGPPK